MNKLLLISLLAISFNSFADVGSGTFTAPTERANNTKLLESEIAGYKVYIDGKALPDLLPSTATSFSLEVTNNITVTLTTIDTDGRESSESEPIALTGKALPNPPTVINITINIGIVQ